MSLGLSIAKGLKNHDYKLEGVKQANLLSINKYVEKIHKVF